MVCLRVGADDVIGIDDVTSNKARINGVMSMMPRPRGKIGQIIPLDCDIFCFIYGDLEI